MASQTDIYNRALSAVGDLRVSSPTEPSAQATACSDAWDIVRREMLVEHPWNFAKEYVSRSATTTTPPWRWSYEYILPADCLQVREVKDLDDDGWEVVSERRLYCDDAGPISLTYTKDVTDCGAFPPRFVVAVAMRLAVEIAEQLTQSNTKQEILIAKADRALRRARMADGREGPPLKQRAGRWITARMS